MIIHDNKIVIFSLVSAVKYPHSTAMDKSSSKFQFAIDRGGTFTDVFARCPNGKIRTLKLLSEDPANYSDAPREGIRRILEQVSSTRQIHVSV